MNKPRFLYHGTQNKNIEIFEPRTKTVRHKEEGPVVFATEDEVSASKFIVPCNDLWSQLSRFNNIHLAIYSNKRKFTRNDKGGAIYKLPSNSFSLDKRFSVASKEWTSKAQVKPFRKLEYTSGFEAMLSMGVQIYFVTPKQLEEIKIAEDHGISILQKLKSENTKLNRNEKKLK